MASNDDLPSLSQFQKIPSKLCDLGHVFALPLNVCTFICKVRMIDNNRLCLPSKDLQ